MNTYGAAMGGVASRACPLPRLRPWHQQAGLSPMRWRPRVLVGLQLSEPLTPRVRDRRACARRPLQPTARSPPQRPPPRASPVHPSGPRANPTIARAQPPARVPPCRATCRAGSSMFAASRPASSPPQPRKSGQLPRPTRRRHRAPPGNCHRLVHGLGSAGESKCGATNTGQPFEPNRSAQRPRPRSRPLRDAGP